MAWKAYIATRELKSMKACKSVHANDNIKKVQACGFEEHGGNTSR